VFLVNSRQRYFSCGPACAGQALSRSYGRFFAEFLGEKSLVLLGLLALSTCVGFRYGFTISNLRGFSWKHAQSTWQNKSSTLPQPLGFRQLAECAGFTKHTPSSKGRQTTKALDLLHSVTPSKNNEGLEY